MRNSFCASALAATLLLTAQAVSAETVIADEKGCPYQIVLPDNATHPILEKTLADSANLLQEMFVTNGWTVAVVSEAQAQPDLPGIYLGNTAAARNAGLDPDTLPIWTYAWKLSGRNLIIAGRDWAAAPIKGSDATPCSHGTVKGLLDFMRQYCGTRFLLPGGRTGIEHLATTRIAVPDDLDLCKEPMLNYNSGGHPTTDLSLIALNFFDNVTTEFFAHTHEIAIPAETYAETHPEYFALVGGKRIREYKHGWLGMVKEPHLCYSNPDVQELIYKDMLRSFDAGYPEYLSLQADGFTPCECDACKALFNTSDWGEKLWQLNRLWAERLLKDRPGKFLVVTAYTVTGKPPTSFTEFPPNLRVSVGGYPQAFETWSKCSIPAGFISYLHAWGGYHLCGYLPVRTPLYSEKTAKLFKENHVRGVGLDSPPANLWALEGPTVYVYGRMLDNPESNSVLELQKEYLEAAYGRAAPTMTRFFDDLHHTLEIYAEVFGVDNGTFQVYPHADGHSGRYLTWESKLRLIGFLYPPETLQRLEQALTQAERVENLNARQRLRLILTRREFEYLRGTARVTHLYQAYLTSPNKTSLGLLLDEMEDRQNMILTWYVPRKEYIPGIFYQQPITSDWPMYIGGSGHFQDHLFRNGGSYLSQPVPPFTWDIAAMRQAPLFELSVLHAAQRMTAPTLDAPEWDAIAPTRLGALKLGDAAPQWTGEVRVAYSADALYVRFDGQLPENWIQPPTLQRDDPEIPERESFSLVLAPDGNPARFLRFAGGSVPTALYDARRGFLEDSIDPRFNQDDTSWNPAVGYVCAVAADNRSWRALWTLPFAALEATAPIPGTEWRANFGRIHELRRWAGIGETSIWSSNPNTDAIDDTSAFGTLRFD